MRIGAMTLVIGFLLVVGCTDRSGTEGASGVREGIDAVADAVEEAAEAVQSTARVDAWVREEADSAIDGRVVSAHRSYVLGDHLQFDVEARCVVQTGAVDVSIESYVGDPSRPSPGSEFATEFVSNAFGSASLPVGRVKPSGVQVRPLATLFAVSNTASNRLEMRALSRYSDLTKLPAEFSGANDKEINFVRAVKELFPLSVELNNGAGKNELLIDAAPELLGIFDDCGGSGDLVRPEAVERLRAEALAEQERRQEQDRLKAERELQAAAQATQDLIAAQKECRNRGTASYYQGIGRIDCENRFPEDIAAFNADVDAIEAEIMKHRFKCETSRFHRESVVNFAHSNGIGKAMDYAKEQWCAWL